MDVPGLDCCVYGAAFHGTDCDGLLEGFRADTRRAHAVGVLHGDPTQVTSPYCPVTAQQVQRSALDYLALGHVHKAGSFRTGKTLCAWPGCPMGRGYDEQGEKGYYIVTLDTEADITFIPLGLPRFHDLEVGPEESLDALLPPAGNEDFYRITFTGMREALNLSELEARYAHFPHLLLRDETVPPVDIWGSAGEDTFEGTYFQLLRSALDTATEEDARHIRLAAKISRQLLDGQEVELP